MKQEEKVKEFLDKIKKLCEEYDLDIMPHIQPTLKVIPKQKEKQEIITK